MYLQLPEPPRSPAEPVLIKHVSKQYGDKVIWDDVSLEIIKGDKIALVGPNGIGKSTMLKMIAGTETPTSGTIEINPRTVLGYFAQHQAEALVPSRTIMEETLYGLNHQQEEMARNLLARLLFKGDEVFKSVGVLSGGERSRVALAKFLLRPANFYLLDEPTNHLDPVSRVVLQDALGQFEGTILMASHDERLIDAVATGIYEVENGKLVMVKDPTDARMGIEL
jgi:ATP-binding cassette subfamily F protein 3